MSKKTGNVRTDNLSLSARLNPGEACTMPSLISSRQIAGHLTVLASRWASVVLPTAGGPLTTMRVGREATPDLYRPPWKIYSGRLVRDR